MYLAIATTRAEHSVGSVQNRTEPKKPKTELRFFSKPNRIIILNRTEPTELFRFGFGFGFKKPKFLKTLYCLQITICN